MTELLVVAARLRESKSDAEGFDAQNGKYTDMIRAGVIDPTKVARTALQDAASIAGLLITTEAMIAEKPGEEKSLHLRLLIWVVWAVWVASKPIPYL